MLHLKAILLLLAFLVYLAKQNVGLGVLPQAKEKVGGF